MIEISSWDDLRDLENKDFKVLVKKRSAVIKPKSKRAKKHYPYGYLNTHTFKSHEYKKNEKKLRDRGFDVEFCIDEYEEY